MIEEHRRLSVRKSSLLLRSEIIQSIRRFFIEHDYMEVETPCLIPAPAPEAHIDAVNVGEIYLHTSPELCMKRLLSAGYSRIFQICKCYREGERGDLHLPEFTLLEWYHAGINYIDLMTECEEMILFLSHDTGFGNKIKRRGAEIDLQRPWDRISVRDAFRRFTSWSMEKALESDCFDEIMVDEIESNLGKIRPVFLYDYPSSQGALARHKADEPDLAERFELYIGGLELANAFTELTDAAEQRERFQAELVKRRQLGKKVYPIPEKFLESLHFMPPSAGIALGVDRLVMIFADLKRVDDAVPFTPEEL